MIACSVYYLFQKLLLPHILDLLSDLYFWAFLLDSFHLFCDFRLWDLLPLACCLPEEVSVVLICSWDSSQFSFHFFRVSFPVFPELLTLIFSESDLLFSTPCITFQWIVVYFEIVILISYEIVSYLWYALFPTQTLCGTCCCYLINFAIASTTVFLPNFFGFQVFFP